MLIEALRAWSNCEEYTAQQALMTFAFGVASELVGEKLGDLVAKYGVPAVAAGLRKLGMEELAERLLRNADEVLDGSSPPSVCGINSFSADTVVMTDEGPKAISALEVGDVVLAYNEATGQTDYYPVVATIAHEDLVVQYLTIEGEIIITTPNHPFYTAEGEWVPAGKLRVGDAIRKADGHYGVVQASAFVYQPQPMYNLTVAEAHTYFVGDGQWLVHNCTLNYKGRVFRALNGKGDGGGPSQAAAEASFRARELADELRGQIPGWANSEVTVGVAVLNGQYHVTAFKPGNMQVWNQIESFLQAKPGYHWVSNNAAPGSDMAHAERILFNNGHATIGISNTTGPCRDTCRPFFGTRPQVEIAWPEPR